jgi:hypothetical protein
MVFNKYARIHNKEKNNPINKCLETTGDPHADEIRPSSHTTHRNQLEQT